MPKLVKMGRPKKPKAEKKGQVLTLRLTDAERKAVEAAAKMEGLPVSEWLRVMVLRGTSRT